MLFTVLRRVYMPKDKRDEFEVVASTDNVGDAIKKANKAKGEIRITVNLDEKFAEQEKTFTPIHYSEAIRQYAVRNGGLRRGETPDPWYGLREYVSTAESAMQRCLKNKLPGAFRDYMMEIDEETRQRSRAPKSEAALANDQS